MKISADNCYSLFVCLFVLLFFNVVWVVFKV
jgi:hypothetical protein